MSCNEGQERSNQRQKHGHDRAEPPLQPAWRADADQLPHEEPEIETTRVDQQSFQNVGVPAQVHAAHPAGLVEMREGPLQALPTQPQQAQAPCAANASSIAIDRGARLGLVLPVPSAPIGFRDVAADADGFEIDERLIAVIPLVADDLLQAIGASVVRAIDRVDR